MQADDMMKRRRFLKAAAIAGASAGLVSEAFGAESKTKKIRSLKRDFIRIGMVGYGPFSRAMEYTQALNDPSVPPRTNMQVVAVWGRDDGYTGSLKGSEEWKKKRLGEIQAYSSKENLAKYGIKNVVKRPEDMASLVDGVFINDPDNALALARPFLAKGMPVYIASPIALNIKEAREIVRLAKAGGSVLVAGSSVPWLDEFQVIKTRIDPATLSLYYADGLINGFCATFPDIIETAQMLVGGKVVRCSTHGMSWPKDEDPISVPPVMTHLEYQKPEKGNPIIGVVTTSTVAPYRNWAKVHLRNETIETGVMIEGSVGAVDTAEHLWLPFLRTVGRAFETGVWPQDEATILQKVEIMLMLHRSGTEGSRPVEIARIEDYSLPRIQTEKA